MANNGGRQGNAGGGGGNGQMNEHVEFTVKAEEDLYLEGNENTIRRVTAETNYSCLMLKTQRFSSLFRHYAKYHGLRKDDLEYYFVNALENEDTPESVQLQRGDTIMVRRQRKPGPPEIAADDEEYFKDFRELLEDEEHMDAVFLVHAEGGGIPIQKLPSTKKQQRVVDVNSPMEDVKPSMTLSSDSAAITTPPPTADLKPRMVEIRAHKCILTARADYFKALFRKDTFRESSTCTIRVEEYFGPKTVSRMLEFVYTNRIFDLSGDISIDPQEILDLLHMGDIWQLRDLKRLCEHELMKVMDVDNVARMYCATEEYHANRLAKACIDFIMENIREVTANQAFQEEMRHYPHLCIPVLKAAADLIPEPVRKKQRTGSSGQGTGVGGDGCSSPVPSDS